MNRLSRHSFLIAFGLGALAVLWVAAAVASSHFLVLVMTAVIGAVYVFAALELRHYRVVVSHDSPLLVIANEGNGTTDNQRVASDRAVWTNDKLNPGSWVTD